MIEFRKTEKVSHLHDPRAQFALTAVKSEVRQDPLTGDTSRICHFSFPPREVPALDALDEATRANCPFCPGRVEQITPRYPESLLPGGRMRRGEALLVPNLFPYDDVSAIVVMSKAHCLPMAGLPPRIIADALLLARDFIRIAQAQLAGREAWGLVTWNYMPPSGASQVHPHLQVIVTDSPGNALRRELAAETAFLARHGVPYPQALLEAEAGAAGGERLVMEEAGIAWGVPYSPCGLMGDVQATFRGRATLAELEDAQVEAYAAQLSRIAAAYARLGLWSFNLTLFPDAATERSGRHWLAARLLPRLYLHPHLHNSDAAYMQLLLGEKFAMVHPERHAADLRAALSS